jgi:hypothetical protein
VQAATGTPAPTPRQQVLASTSTGDPANQLGLLAALLIVLGSAGTLAAVNVAHARARGR